MKLAKWAFTAIALVFLWYEIFIKNNAVDLFSGYQLKVKSNLIPVIWVVALMPVNWGIDALKWRWLLKRHTQISILTSIRGVLMGLSVGLFTPNGVGEFAGRMLAVKKSFREESVAASIAGSLAQLAITITVGGGCIMFFVGNYVAPDYLNLARMAAILTVAVGFYAYFKLPNIARFLFARFKRIDKFKKFQSSLGAYSQRELFTAYLFGLARYLVFCTQLGILLFAIGDIEFATHAHLVWLIPIYFYVQTLIPTVALSEIGVRGLILSYLFIDFLNEPDVILASFIIWLVNLIIPGLFGLFLVLRTKITRS